MKKHLEKLVSPMIAIVIMCIMAASFNAKAQGPDSANMEKIGDVSAYS
ncbi:hypothetical protein [uncultured Muribaculum sp.]|nr:hypothetical protein [uncultured Muribaculum sp.]